MQQRSEEWLMERLCRITGTRISAVMGTKKARNTLMYEMIREKIMLSAKEFKRTQAMQRGIDTEDEARKAYELVNDVLVQEVGLIVSKENEMFACSPDGLIGFDGGIEIKCLSEENHLKVMLEDMIEKNYYYQIQWCIYCTDRQWWDYFGYCNTLGPCKIYQKRFDRDGAVINHMLEMATSFIDEYKKSLDFLEIGDI